MADADDAVLWAAWGETDRLNSLKISRHDGGQWCYPESVELDYPKGQFALALDNELNPWAAYVHWNAPEWQWMYVRRSADTWTRPAVFFSDTGPGSVPAMAPHPKQGVQVLWRYGWFARLLTAQATADSWTTPHVLDSFPMYLHPHHLGITRLDNRWLMAGWSCYPDNRGRNLHTSIGAGHSWTEPVHVVFPPPQHINNPPLMWMDRYQTLRIVWQAGYMLYSGRFDGRQWVEPVLLDSGGSFTGCTDTAGWAWVLHVRDDGRGVVRYHDGDSWSAPMPGPPDSLAGATIAAAYGRIWVVWCRLLSETKTLLYYSSADRPQVGIKPRDSAEMRVRAWPNPFGHRTRIQVRVPSLCRLTVRIYDCGGRLVKVLADQQFASGAPEFEWWPSGAASDNGVYFLQVLTDMKEVGTFKLVRTAHTRTRSAR